jgi:hypothetical protein
MGIKVCVLFSLSSSDHLQLMVIALIQLSVYLVPYLIVRKIAAYKIWANGYHLNVSINQKAVLDGYAAMVK